MFYEKGNSPGDPNAAVESDVTAAISKTKTRATVVIIIVANGYVQRVGPQKVSPTRLVTRDFETWNFKH